MSTAVRFAEPRSPAAQELTRLVDERAGLSRRRDELDAARRSASEQAQGLSVELAALEQRAAAGAKVNAAERTKLERELAAAKAATHEPWAERIAGVEAAARDVDRAVALYVAGNLDELLAELHENAEAAASAVDAACRELVTAYHRRQTVDAHVIAVAATVRIPRAGDVAPTRAEAVVREANRLLDGGGEQAPLLRTDPRAPRHGQVPAEVDESRSASFA